ncbi:phosphopentomutase [Ruminococcaceae bacterium OttesenSCG-928-L11]|nr:phosphopentomutase [Ruminococcaceae bacterium OttesenSCG-928-L11]
MNYKRIFLVVLDSAGIGELPDADQYGDSGSNTFRALWNSGGLHVPHMAGLGLFHIDGMDYAPGVEQPSGCYGRLAEASKGKDTTTGHWEIAGVLSKQPLPTYPDGFPPEVLEPFRQATDREILCNRPASGTQVLLDYGPRQKETGGWIVYTSADSVFQLAANEAWIPLEELYRACETARSILTGEHGVGRVIARPYVGEYPRYTRTTNRHDYSLEPPGFTMLDGLAEQGYDVIGIGKIGDIFAGRGVRDSRRTTGNGDGMEQTSALQKEAFHGLAFVNLVDFDMLYGHRNDVEGYTAAMNEFDRWLGGFLAEMAAEDLLLITADHGCDPSTESTDHSREYTPLLAYSPRMKQGCNLGTRATFADIAATVTANFGVDFAVGSSFLPQLLG